MESSGTSGTGARERWIRKVEAEYRDADITRGFILDGSRLVVQECDQLRKRDPFPGLRLYPVLLSSVIGQQETTGPAVRVSQILSCQLVLECSLEVGQCPIVRDLHLDGRLQITVGDREPDIRMLLVGDLFFPRYLVDIVRPLADLPGKVQSWTPGVGQGS